MKEEKILYSYKFNITVLIVILCTITTLISVGFGALNQNLNISGEVKYTKDVGNMIKKYTTSTSTDFHSSAYEDKITSVDFLDNKNIPNSAVTSWDVSVNNNGKVMAWIIDDPNNSGYYKLYVGADGDVVGNTNSRYIFYGMSEVQTINFNNNFDTSQVTDMAYMFRIYTKYVFNDYTDYENKLTAINGLEYFDTSNVTSMWGMFYTCDKQLLIQVGLMISYPCLDLVKN